MAVIGVALLLGAVAGAFIARSIIVRNCEKALAERCPLPTINFNLPEP
jgi:hypothetical protein